MLVVATSKPLTSPGPMPSDIWVHLDLKSFKSPRRAFALPAKPWSALAALPCRPLEQLAARIVNLLHVSLLGLARFVPNILRFVPKMRFVPNASVSESYRLNLV
ncbi:hypothetical protein PSPO01_16635 [Paraphaeosphaeria sporulosa]